MCNWTNDSRGISFRISFDRNKRRKVLWPQVSPLSGSVFWFPSARRCLREQACYLWSETEHGSLPETDTMRQHALLVCRTEIKIGERVCLSVQVTQQNHFRVPCRLSFLVGGRALFKHVFFIGVIIINHRSQPRYHTHPYQITLPSVVVVNLEKVTCWCDKKSPEMC